MRYELWIGLRYTRAKRRNHFISFISLISMLGIGLGVAALIVVLSVMNGFHKELRTRILGVASHIQVSGWGGELRDWQSVQQAVKKDARVLAAAPYIQAQGMLAMEQQVKGAIVRGVLPELEETVADFAQHIKYGRFEDLSAGAFNMVLGIELARALQVTIGDKVTLIAPQGSSRRQPSCHASNSSGWWVFSRSACMNTMPAWR